MVSIGVVGTGYVGLVQGVVLLVWNECTMYGCY